MKTYLQLKKKKALIYHICNFAGIQFSSFIRIFERDLTGGAIPVGVLLRKEEDGVMGGVTGGVRFPLVWRGGVETLLRDRLPVRARDNLGCTFFFTASCSRRAASVMNLQS